jgi:hypothetical protein
VRQPKWRIALEAEENLKQTKGRCEEGHAESVER